MVYNDPLGLDSPVLITEKIVYSETCLRKLKLDVRVSDEICRSWDKWLKGFENLSCISVPAVL